MKYQGDNLMSQEKSLNLSEAAQEILNANRKTKDAQGDKFGQGKTLNDTANKGEQDVGNPGIEKPAVNAPSATPPGQTPPVGSEPAKKLPKQPAESGIANTDVDQLPKKGVNEGEDDVNEDIAALMAGENLSEEFKKKATAIFEAAVKAKVAELAEELEQKYVAQFEEAYAELVADTSKKVDESIEYFAAQWMEENKLALQSNLKSEITEGFINSLKQVFEEHYIDLPEEKVDVVSELASKVEALEKQVNEELAKNIDLTTKLSEQKKVEALHSVCEGLTISQAEKIKTIAESVEFNSAEEFVTQMEAIKESYFSQSATVKPASKDSLNDTVELNEETETKSKKLDPVMEAYVKGISKSLIK